MIDWDTIPDCDPRTAEQWEGMKVKLQRHTSLMKMTSLGVYLSGLSARHTGSDVKIAPTRHGRCTQIYAEEVC
jgi:hypothetical protein